MDSLQRKFFSDPDWPKVGELLKGYIAPLVDLDQMDFSQNPTQFKAELKAAKRLYDGISKFLQDTQVTSKPLKEIKNIFK